MHTELRVHFNAIMKDTPTGLLLGGFHMDTVLPQLRTNDRSSQLRPFQFPLQNSCHKAQWPSSMTPYSRNAQPIKPEISCIFNTAKRSLCWGNGLQPKGCGLHLTLKNPLYFRIASHQTYFIVLTFSFHL